MTKKNDTDCCTDDCEIVGELQNKIEQLEFRKTRLEIASEEVLKIIHSPDAGRYSKEFVLGLIKGTLLLDLLYSKRPLQ